jgi:hypothetical protein
MTAVRFSAGANMGFVLFTTASRPALGPTQPIHWVPGVLTLGKSGRGVKLTPHLYLAPRLRMREAIPPLLPYVFMVCYIVKHRDNFTFTFPLLERTKVCCDYISLF